MTSFYFSLLNHVLCLLTAFLFFKVHPALAFILMLPLPIVLFGFPSQKGVKSLFGTCTGCSIQVGSVLISSVCHSKPSGFSYQNVNRHTSFAAPADV
jgi:hypothetical protein